jgi:hypothetical protein
MSFTYGIWIDWPSEISRIHAVIILIIARLIEIIHISMQVLLIFNFKNEFKN